MLWGPCCRNLLWGPYLRVSIPRPRCHPSLRRRGTKTGEPVQEQCSLASFDSETWLRHPSLPSLFLQSGFLYQDSFFFSSSPILCFTGGTVYLPWPKNYSPRLAISQKRTCVLPNVSRAIHESGLCPIPLWAWDYLLYSLSGTIDLHNLQGYYMFLVKE